MERLRLLLLRHGESASNAHPRAASLPEEQGDLLTPRGEAQARAAAVALRRRGATRLLSSPMRRAQQTAAIVAAELGLEVETHPGIHELREQGDFGSLSPEEQRLRRWSEWMSEHADDPEHAPPGAESFNTVLGRVRRLKADLEAGEPGQSVLCVSHGIFIRFFFADSLLGEGFRVRDVRRLWQLRTENCGLSVFEHGEPMHPADPEIAGWRCRSWMERCWDE